MLWIGCCQEEGNAMADYKLSLEGGPTRAGWPASAGKRDVWPVLWLGQHPVLSVSIHDDVVGFLAHGLSCLWPDPSGSPT